MPENLAPQPPSETPDHQIPTAETRWDALHPHFLQIVKLASEIAHNTDSPLPFFMSLEPGLAMPLFFEEDELLCGAGGKSAVPDTLLAVETTQEA